MTPTAAPAPTPTPLGAPPPAPAPARSRLSPEKAVSLLLRHGALVALVVACLFGFARYAAFLTPENLLNVLRQNSMLGFVALGMTFVILTAGIDLSVGSLLAVAGIVAAALSPQGTPVGTRRPARYGRRRPVP